MQTIADDGRLALPKLEFYINNTCNLTCQNCNRFNNYNFKGWQDYNTLRTQIEFWATKLFAPQMTILGGEPFLNPSLNDWITGVSTNWQRQCQTLTNGTLLNKRKNVYDLFTEEFAFQHNLYNGWPNWIGISWHNASPLEELFDQIASFMHHERDALNEDFCDYSWVDKNGVQVRVWIQDKFEPAAVYRNQAGNLTLRNNKPEDAHRHCGQANNKNYHIVNGKVYKCGPVALFPEFLAQHDLDISAEDKNLIGQYAPLTMQDWDNRGLEFFAKIDNVLPQCKFCPNLENRDLIAISPNIKGKKVFTV